MSGRRRVTGVAGRPGTAARCGLLGVETLEPRCMFAADAGFATSVDFTAPDALSWAVLPADTPGEIVAPMPMEVSWMATPAGPESDPGFAFDPGAAVDSSGETGFTDFTVGSGPLDDSWVPQPDWRGAVGGDTVEPATEGTPGPIAYCMFPLLGCPAAGPADPAGDGVVENLGEVTPAVAAAASPAEGRRKSPNFAGFSGIPWPLVNLTSATGGFVAGGDPGANGGFVGGRRRPRLPDSSHLENVR